jgi:hypothetical protein
VREVRRDDGVAADRAQALDVVPPVDLASSWADYAARTEEVVRRRRPGIELGRR